jgi:signal transduction histidine kinase/ActR/RegA family two-component response regulator
MRSLQNVPIKRKLTLVTMLTTGVALVVACAAFLVLDLASHRVEVRREMTTLASVIGANSAQALATKDQQAGAQTLALLKDNPKVVAACIFTVDGTIVAKYLRHDTEESLQLPASKKQGAWFEQGQLMVARPVRKSGAAIGTVYLICDLQKLSERCARYAGILFLVTIAASFAAFLLSSRLHRMISEPILSLTRLARAVTEQKNYSVRAEKHGDYEIDLLNEAFNQMLMHIQERDAQLHKAKDELEKRVQARTWALQQELAERKRTEDQLRQSQKMEAIGRLAGGVAHDFNNVLTVIAGYSDLLMRRLGEEHPLYKNAEEIQTAAQRAASLTRQLLAFSRKQVLQPKVLDLNIVVAGMEKMLRRLIGEDIELRTKLDPHLGKVKADPGQIEQVIMNLAVNARDAMPMGGKLIIETEGVTIDKGTMFQDGELDPREYITISISDTGVGMTEEVKAHLFEPFFTTKGKEKGTGLGLPTSYGIVKQSGGHINVYSEPGKGTTFKVFLPRVEKAAEMLAQHDEAKLLPRGKETVLLVEDEPAVRELAACVLRESGYQVLEACNGKDGMRMAGEHQDHAIDLLITDVIMPHMGGKELADNIRDQRPKIKVLFISGYTDDALAHHGVLDDGTAFLEKPFSPARLVHKVREVLDQPAAALV